MRKKSDGTLIIFMILGLLLCGMIVGAVINDTVFKPDPVEIVEYYIDYNTFRCTTLNIDPVFTYDSGEQIASLTFECAPEIMLQFMPAVEIDQ